MQETDTDRSKVHLTQAAATDTQIMAARRRGISVSELIGLTPFEVSGLLDSQRAQRNLQFTNANSNHILDRGLVPGVLVMNDHLGPFEIVSVNQRLGRVTLKGLRGNFSAARLIPIESL